VTYALVSGPATVTAGGLVTITGAGSIVVTATKAGDGNYLPVTSAALTIAVAKAQQATLTIDPVEGKKLGDEPFMLSVSGGSSAGLVTYELVSGTAVIVSPDGLVTIVEVGTAVIRATMAGNDNYEPVSTQIAIIVSESDGDTINIAALMAALNKFNDLIESKYTEETWAAAAEAADIAEGLMEALLEDSQVTQEEIDDATAALVEALEGLIEVVITRYLRLGAQQPANVTIRRNITYQISVDTNSIGLMYVSSMPTVASVSAVGLVTARSAGISIIRVVDIESGQAVNLVVNVIN